MGYKIRRKTAQELLKVVGYELADQFSDKVLVRKLGYLNDLSEEDAAAHIVGPLKRVFSTLRLALRDGQQAEIVGDESLGGKSPGRPKSDDSMGALIVAMLKNASSSDPTTKSKVAAKLLNKFPDRDYANIKETVDKWIMSYCKRDGHDIRKNTNGFWIALPDE